MTTVLSSIWNFFWGDAEKTELLRHLLAKGVDEQEAAQATKICPRIPQQNGQPILLLQRMISNNASEREAVKALLKANGNPEQTIQLYHQTMRRQSMLKEFTNIGIPISVAKQALESSNWDKKKARASLEMQKTREMEQAKREYQAHKQVVQKLAASARKKKPTVHKAKLSHKQAKHSRHRATTKRKTKEPVIDVDDSSLDDESHDPSTSGIDEMDDVVEETKKHEYHSSDDSDNEPSSSQEHASSPSRRPTPTAQKNKVFALRKNISVATCKSLAQALRVLDKNSFDAGVQELQKRPDFCTGSAAGYLQLLAESPSLRELVLKTLDETAANRS